MNVFLKWLKARNQEEGRTSDSNGPGPNAPETHLSVFVTKEDVISYKEELQQKCYAPRSINSMLASINSLFHYLGWCDLIVRSLKIQKQIFCPEERELKKTEYERLVNAAVRKNDRRMELILQTICGTGIRVSELQYVTWEAVKRGTAYVSCKAKTRPVIIVRALQKKLLRYAKEKHICSRPIFITRTGKPEKMENLRLVI